MSKIFETFGFRLEDTSPQALQVRKDARCPYMGRQCDGGGNRHLSNIPIQPASKLAKKFPSKTIIPSSVCSLSLRAHADPWIVCPRRLLFLGSPEQGGKALPIISTMVEKAGYKAKKRFGVWPELRMTYKSADQAVAKHLTCTFDYFAMPICKQSVSGIAKDTGLKIKDLLVILRQADYDVKAEGSKHYVHDFPSNVPMIVEIMTSSSSGGKKQKRTTIPLAFEDAMLGREHEGPGINYRQVWARMASQLLVKSEVAIAWGGKAFWVLQDQLARYISQTTGLDLESFRNQVCNDVNILSLSYDRQNMRPLGMVNLHSDAFYSGPIEHHSKSRKTQPAFHNIIRAPVVPTRKHLLTLLAKRKYASTFVYE